MIPELLFVIFLVLLNGFFVAAEFAVVKVRASQLEVKTTGNVRLSRITKHIMGNLDGYLAATQLGITIASLGLGWVGEHVFSEIFMLLFEKLGYASNSTFAHSIAVPLAFVFVTFMHVVFGELMPKSIAIRYSLPTTIALAYPLSFFYIIFRPFIYLFNGFANFSLNLMGIGASHGHGNDIHTEDELRMILKESQTSETSMNKYEIIDKVFEFDDKEVREIMTPRGDVTGIDMDNSIEDIIENVINQKFSRYPVYKKDLNDIIGILHVHDLLEWVYSKKEADIKIDNLVKPAIFISPIMRVGDLLLELQKKKKHIAIVNDERGTLLGIITLEDIIEELLGEIYDENDDMTIVHNLGENSFLVNATSKISEINKWLPEPIPLPEGMKFGTLSGLIIYTAPKNLIIGEVLPIGRYNLKIANRKNNKIKLVELTLLPENGQ